MYAIKNAILMKEHYPDTEISIFYIDIRAFGKGFEEFYKRSEEEFGIKFIKGRVSEIQEDPDTHNLLLKAFNTITGTLLNAEADLAVLSVGLRPPRGQENLAKMLDIPLGDNGFFAESDLKYSPVNTARDGIFIAGVSQGPKDIPDSVAQASGAASAAAVLLSKVKVGE
jgi:heterodisulfide reductase subunit A